MIFDRDYSTDFSDQIAALVRRAPAPAWRVETVNGRARIVLLEPWIGERLPTMEELRTRYIDPLYEN